MVYERGRAEDITWVFLFWFTLENISHGGLGGFPYEGLRVLSPRALRC